MREVHLQLTEQLYDQAKRRAVRAGFQTVEEYASNVLTKDLREDTEDYDSLFTPARMEHLDKIAAEVRAGGKTYTMEEVSVYLDEKRADWIRKNG